MNEVNPVPVNDTDALGHALQSEYFGVPLVGSDQNTENAIVADQVTQSEGLDQPVEADGQSGSTEQQTDTGSNLEDIASDVTLRQRMGNVALGFKNDWRDANPWGKSVQVAALGGQILERVRISETVIAPAVVGILNETRNPNLTSLALLGMVGVSQGLISHSWAEAMDKTPKTVEAINEGFPGLVEMAEDIGPAKDRKWYSSIREGAAAFLSYGVTPFIVADRLNNPKMTRGELHKQAAQLTGKCALFGFGLSRVVGEVVVRSNEQVATAILNVLEKPYVWFGIAMAFEAPRLIAKRIERHRNKKLNSQQLVA